MSIAFTQYLRPNGQRTEVTISRPDPVEEMAQSVLAAGYRFEAEVLMNGMVSFTVFDPREEVDVAIKLSSNGPEVANAVDALVADAYRLVTAGTWDQREDDVEFGYPLSHHRGDDGEHQR